MVILTPADESSQAGAGINSKESVNRIADANGVWRGAIFQNSVPSAGWGDIPFILRYSTIWP